MRQLLSLALACLLALGMCGCSNNEDEGERDSSYSESSLSGVTLRVFHSRRDMAKQFDEMYRAFSEETGIQVVPMAAGSDTMAQLRTLMEGDDAPTLFPIDGFHQLQEWVEQGVALDLETVDNGDFQSMISTMPVDMRLRVHSTGSYGVPCGLEGYGYIVDIQMLDDLFGAGNGQLVADKLRTCSYEQFIEFCDAVDKYIATPYAMDLDLGGDAFVFAAVKTGRAENLSGVFAFAGAEPSSYGRQMLNVALNTVLPNAREAAYADREQFDQLALPLLAYASALDVTSRHVGGMNGPARRGKDLTDHVYFGHDQSIQMLADGNALFLLEGTWAGGELERANADISSRLELIPVKLPLTDDMIVTDKTALEFGRSIPVYATDYYAINAKAPKQEQEAAVEFLIWLHETRNLQQYVVDDFGLIPWYQWGDVSIPDPLSESLLSYVQEGRILGDPFRGAPEGWADEIFGRKLMDEYLVKEDWTDEDREAIADFAVVSWRDVRDRE